MKLKWGQTVRVSELASEDCRPGELAEIVGMRDAEAGLILPNKVYVPAGSIILLLEFGDGASVEVPDVWAISSPDDK